MDLILNNLLIPVEKDTQTACVQAAAQKLNTNCKEITVVRILSKALDANSKDRHYFTVSLIVRTPAGFENKKNFPLHSETTTPNSMQKPVIIGFGPAGMFAALELIDHGIKPYIFERGKKIEERTRDVKNFIAERVLDPESNIQFGEGGAGSYSDGKLFSRIKNSTYANKVLNTFIRFGAPPAIGYIRKPHLGTDVLCNIVHNMRNYILDHGGQIEYESKMTDILMSGGKIKGVVINGDKQYLASVIYLAVGHSARDTFSMLNKKGIAIEQKPIAVGVRVEHPAEIINLIRYGSKYKDFPDTGAASYSFTFTNKKTGRGVYTFCMCPGGEIINASSHHGMLVLNGMSYSDRSSAFSNAAITVTCHTLDYKSADPLAGIEFQKDIESRAFHAAGKTWKAPAQNLVDFLYGRTSNNLNENSYKMGTVSVDLSVILPEFVCKSLATAFSKWKREYPLFVSEQAILLGIETRTSSPIRILRSKQYESLTTENLYPIGEGSGYSSGITSSTMDAIKAVEASLAKANNHSLLRPSHNL